MRRETLAEKAERLTTRTGAGGGMPPAPPPPRPSILNSRSFLQPGEREAAMEAEMSRARTAREHIVTGNLAHDIPRDEEDPEDVFARLQSLARKGEDDGDSTQESPPPRSAADLVQAPSKQETPKPQEIAISSYDQELIEMVDQLDPAELLLKGSVSYELDVLEGTLSISVRSLRKSDIREVQKDIDDFRRGRPDPDSPGDRIVPSLQAIEDFSEMRYLAQGVLGINGKSLPGDWIDRFGLLEQLPSPAYDAVYREFIKFLRAVGLLFPDKAKSEEMKKLREVIKKAQAHH